MNRTRRAENVGIPNPLLGLEGRQKRALVTQLSDNGRSATADGPDRHRRKISFTPLDKRRLDQKAAALPLELLVETARVDRGSTSAWPGYIEISSDEDDFGFEDVLDSDDDCNGSEYSNGSYDSDGVALVLRDEDAAQWRHERGGSTEAWVSSFSNIGGSGTRAKQYSPPRCGATTAPETTSEELEPLCTRQPGPIILRPLLSLVPNENDADRHHHADALRNLKSESIPSISTHEWRKQRRPKLGAADEALVCFKSTSQSQSDATGVKNCSSIRSNDPDLYVDCAVDVQSTLHRDSNHGLRSSLLQTPTSHGNQILSNTIPTWSIDPTGSGIPGSAPVAPFVVDTTASKCANLAVLDTWSRCTGRLSRTTIRLPFLLRDTRDSSDCPYVLRRYNPPPCWYCAATNHRPYRCPLRRCAICGQLGHRGFKKCPNAHLLCRICRAPGHDGGHLMDTNADNLPDHSLIGGKPFCPYNLTNTSVAIALAKLNNHRRHCSTLNPDPETETRDSALEHASAPAQQSLLCCCITCGGRGHLLCAGQPIFQSDNNANCSTWSTDSSSDSRAECHSRTSDDNGTTRWLESPSCISLDSSSDASDSDSLGSDSMAAGTIRLQSNVNPTGSSGRFLSPTRHSPLPQSSTLLAPGPYVINGPAALFCCRCAKSGHQFSSCTRPPPSLPIGVGKKRGSRKNSAAINVWAPMDHSDDNSDTNSRKGRSQSCKSNRFRRRLPPTGSARLDRPQKYHRKNRISDGSKRRR